MKARHWLLLIGCFVLAIASSYFLALAGEPQSEWIWRDVLGVIE